MTDQISTGTTIPIRSCGHDEYWLQDRIADNPSVLRLGELEVISRERKQSSGGRLDMLLKDPEDDSMYEVEIMLGQTDETHIIRTIEYWDNEKRKWPKRKHYAVLVAETVTSRFYNVIQLLSHAIPIIAIQVSIVEADGKRILHFSKLLDTYEEPEDDVNGDEIHDEEYWRKKAAWTVDTAKMLLEVVEPIFGKASLKFLKHYISISVNGKNYMWMYKRSAGKSLIEFFFSEALLPEGLKVFDTAEVSYAKKKDSVMITADKNMIQSNAKAIQEAAKYVKRSWDE